MIRTSSSSIHRQLRYGGPVFLYAGLIFVLSSPTSLPSAFQPLFDFDKGVHFVEYAILGSLIYRWLSLWGGLGRRTVFLATLLIGVCYAVGDEWHQSFVPGREASFLDLLSDGAGTAAGAAFYPVISRKLPGKKSLRPER